MSKILVIDDAPFWRDLASDALRLKGYDVSTAGNGMDGLALLKNEGADLVIVNVDMPQMEGLSFLAQVRQQENWKNLPVIILTGNTHKKYILRAKMLGAGDYLLKSQFSLGKLLERVQSRLEMGRANPGPAAAPVTTPALVSVGAEATASPTKAPGVAVAQRVAKVASAPPEPPEASRRGPAAIPRLLTREQCVERAEQAMEGRALSGAAAEVVVAAGSPHTELSDLVTVIARDPVLAARILKTANSAAYISKQGTVSTIPDAIRNIGRSTIRDIATSMGVFDAMPRSASDGFHPVRCWQHSLAVATLCARLAPQNSGGQAYLIGLCHDLGEVLFYSHFGQEYRQVVEAQRATGRPLEEIERAMLGITHGELAQTILQLLGLPDVIRRPIAAFHDSSPGSTIADPMGRLLQLADQFAMGSQLASSEQAQVRPLTRIECRSALGLQDPVPPDGAPLRNEIYVLTAMLDRSTPGGQEKTTEPFFARRPARIWLAREPSLSPFDPVAAALESMAELTIRESLPRPANLAGYTGVIAVARTTSAVGFTAQDIKNASVGPDGVSLPTLWLTGRVAGWTGDKGPLKPVLWPVSLRQLAEFIQ